MNKESLTYNGVIIPVVHSSPNFLRNWDLTEPVPRGPKFDNFWETDGEANMEDSPTVIYMPSLLRQQLSRPAWESSPALIEVANDNREEWLKTWLNLCLQITSKATCIPYCDRIFKYE
jgi:hypothetical protein